MASLGCGGAMRAMASGMSRHAPPFPSPLGRAPRRYSVPQPQAA
jgi:hypothetical protein